MRLQVTDAGMIRATLQPRSDGTQSRTYCCPDGHDTAQAAAEHGAQAEIADEMEFWLRAPQVEVVTERRAVKLDEATGKYVEAVERVDPFVADAGRPVHMFDKRAVADKRFPLISQDKRTGLVVVQGLSYRVVYEDAARLVGVLVTRPGGGG